MKFIAFFNLFDYQLASMRQRLTIMRSVDGELYLREADGAIYPAEVRAVVNDIGAELYRLELERKQLLEEERKYRAAPRAYTGNYCGPRQKPLVKSLFAIVAGGKEYQFSANDTGFLSVRWTIDGHSSSVGLFNFRGLEALRTVLCDQIDKDSIFFGCKTGSARYYKANDNELSIHLLHYEWGTKVDTDIIVQPSQVDAHLFLDDQTFELTFGDTSSSAHVWIHVREPEVMKLASELGMVCQARPVDNHWARMFAIKEMPTPGDMILIGTKGMPFGDRAAWLVTGPLGYQVQRNEYFQVTRINGPGCRQDPDNSIWISGAQVLEYNYQCFDRLELTDYVLPINVDRLADSVKYVRQCRVFELDEANA